MKGRGGVVTEAGFEGMAAAAARGAAGLAYSSVRLRGMTMRCAVAPSEHERAGRPIHVLFG